nr:MAG TPA: hypothetical protein [Caudoviricetes sp.]
MVYLPFITPCYCIILNVKKKGTIIAHVHDKSIQG